MATQNNHNNTLPKFLDSHKRQEDGPFTHTIIGNPDYNVYGGSYNIPDDKTDEFLNSITTMFLKVAITHI